MNYVSTTYNDIQVHNHLRKQNNVKSTSNVLTRCRPIWYWKITKFQEVGVISFKEKTLQMKNILKAKSPPPEKWKSSNRYRRGTL